MGSHRRSTALVLLLLTGILAVTFSGRSAGSFTTPRGSAAYFERVRDAIIGGVGRDFAAGAQVSTPAFRSCLRRHLRGALDAPKISGLATLYRRPGAPPFVAQTLNAIALPLARECGHVAWVPELTGAADGLSASYDTGAAVRKLGISYGPYLGVRCAGRERRHCEKVGIDLVFRGPASSVVAIAAGQKIHLRTPGLHSRVPRHDWVGTFHHPGLLPDRPFELHHLLIHIPLEVRVRFADGAGSHALFPHALVSPGWG
jgi:hypothetical protein